MNRELRTTVRSAALIALALLIFPAAAFAEPGDGLRSGNFQLNPGLMLGSGFNSNLFYSSGSEQTRAAPLGIVEPRLRISMIDPTSVDLGFNGAVAWTQYFAVDNEDVSEQSGLSTTLSGNFVVNPRGAVSLRVFNDFMRTNEAPSSASTLTINRIWNRSGAEIGFHPGGRVLTSHLGYNYTLYRHNLFEELDRGSHNLSLKNSWKFLPKTALLLNASFSFLQYQDRPTDRPSVDKIDSMPLRVMGGLNGLLTNRLGARLLAGYGNGFYDSGDSFSGPLALAEVYYGFGNHGLNNRLRAGYEYNFRDSPISNYYTFHRVYAGYEQGFLANRLRLSAEGDVNIRDYRYKDGGVKLPTSTSQQVLTPDDVNDLALGAGANVLYNFTNWWNAELRYRFGTNFTDDQILIFDDVVDIDPSRVILREFVQHQVMIQTTFTY